MRRVEELASSKKGGGQNPIWSETSEGGMGFRSETKRLTAQKKNEI